MNLIRRFLICCLAAAVFAQPAAAQNEVDRLIAAMLGDTPVIDDLHELTDTIGGRATGSQANRDAVAWALKTLRQAPPLAEPRATDRSVLPAAKMILANCQRTPMQNTASEKYHNGPLIRYSIISSAPSHCRSIQVSCRAGGQTLPPSEPRRSL